MLKYKQFEDKVLPLCTHRWLFNHLQLETVVLFEGRSPAKANCSSMKSQALALKTTQNITLNSLTTNELQGGLGSKVGGSNRSTDIFATGKIRVSLTINH